MATTIDNLKSRAQVIRDETVDGQNTAYRVGGLLYDMIDHLDGVNTTIYNIINGGEGDEYNNYENTVKNIIGDAVNVTQIQTSGTHIATIAVNGTSKQLYAPSITDNISVNPLIQSGTKIATINIDGVEKQLFTPSAGNSVAVSQILTSGTHIATITVDGTATQLYAPSGSGEGGGSSDPYDDSAIWEALHQLENSLDEANDLAEQEKERLDGVIDSIDDVITDQIDELMRDAEWVQEHISEGVTEWKSSWDAEIGRYLNTVGVWTKDENGFTTTQWSQLTQTVNSLSTSVSYLYTNGEYAQALQSFVNQKVVDGVASLNLGTLYAEKDAERILRWLYSGLMAHTTNDTTWAALVSAAKDNDTSAISEVRTYVNKLKNGDYVAVANLAAKVDNAISELYAEAGSNYAKTLIFSKVNKNSEDIATIVTEATGDSSSATIATKFANWKAGLITTSNIDGAMSGLIAASDNNRTKAAIIAKVADGISTATISADQVKINGSTMFTGGDDHLDIGIGSGWIGIADGEIYFKRSGSSGTSSIKQDGANSFKIMGRYNMNIESEYDMQIYASHELTLKTYRGNIIHDAAAVFKSDIKVINNSNYYDGFSGYITPISNGKSLIFQNGICIGWTTGPDAASAFWSGGQTSALQTTSV